MQMKLQNQSAASLILRVVEFPILSLTMKNMCRQKCLRFLCGAFVVCQLSVSLPAFAQTAPSVAKELAAQKEVFQIKFDQLKETQKSDVDSLNKRIDDALTTTGQAVDRFGVVTAWIGGLITVLLAGLGLLGFITVTRKTKAEAEAEQAAQAWFNEKAATLLKEIERLENRAQEVHLSMDATVKRVNDREVEVQQSMDRLQAIIGRGQDDKTQRSAPSSTDVSVLQQRDEELQQQPETSYSFDDWNARAHAAYAGGKLTDAIYFWERASQVKGAGAANVAQALYNKGVTQGQTGDNAGAIESCSEVIRRYGDAPEAALRERVAMALFNKGVGLGRTADYAGAIESYNEVIRRYGDAPEAALREQVAMACNELGWRHFVEAKKLWKIDRVAAEQHLQQARQQFDLGVTKMVVPNGVILGNRAYTRFLQGDIEGAEADFGAALTAKSDGGKRLYEATLKDFEVHPTDEDAGMGAMVERLWQAYEVAGRA